MKGCVDLSVKVRVNLVNAKTGFTGEIRVKFGLLLLQNVAYIYSE